MRATVDIDDKLLEEAKKLTPVKNKEGIDKSLFEGAYKKKRLEHLISLYGISPINLTLDIEKF